MESPPRTDHTMTVDGPDNRREVRIRCKPSAVEVYLGGRQRPVTAVVVEVSKSGLRLHADETVPVGSVVQIDMGSGLVVQGDVRHCQMRLDQRSYTVGVLMDTVTGSGRSG